MHTPHAQPAWTSPQRRKRGKGGLWILVGLCCLALMLAGSGALLWYVIYTHGNPGIPRADVPDAMSDQALARMVDEMNVQFNPRSNKQPGLLESLTNPAAPDPNARPWFSKVTLPVSFEQALEMLKWHAEDQTAYGRIEKSQKRVVAEWLYSREVNETHRADIARVLAELYQEPPRDDKLDRALARAFVRWGNSDYVGRFLQASPRDDDLPMMMKLIEVYPSANGTDLLVQLLNGRHADEAERVLANLGAEHAPLLMAELDSGSPSTIARVERILGGWDVNVPAIRFETYLARASGGEAEAWRGIAKMPVQADRQQLVVEALRAFRPDSQSDGAWVEACLAWGDGSFLPDVQRVFIAGSSDGQERALQFIRKFPDATSVPVLVNQLLNAGYSEHTVLVDALIALYRADVAVDFRREVHQPIVERFNDDRNRSKSALRSLLDETDFDYSLLLEQCLEDISIESRRQNALDSLARLPVVPESQFEVAETISGVIRGGNMLQQRMLRSLFLRWTTPRNSYLLDMINDDKFGGEEWKAAMRIALSDKDNLNKLTVPVARALTDFFKDDQAVDVLTEMGTECEDLMILLLQSNNGGEVIGACKVLQAVGTEKSIPHLKRLLPLARRGGFRDVYEAVMMAGTVITNRVGEDTVRQYEVELERQKETESGKEPDDDGGSTDDDPFGGGPPSP